MKQRELWIRECEREEKENTQTFNEFTPINEGRYISPRLCSESTRTKGLQEVTSDFPKNA